MLDATVVRVPDAYPVCDATYRAHLATLRHFLDPIANLHTVGRNGMHKYNNQDHSMYAAMLAVANLHGERHDVWEVNSDFEYHEAGRLRTTWRKLPSVHLPDPARPLPKGVPATSG